MEYRYLHTSINVWLKTYISRRSHALQLVSGHLPACKARLIHDIRFSSADYCRCCTPGIEELGFTNACCMNALFAAVVGQLQEKQFYSSSRSKYPPRHKIASAMLPSAAGCSWRLSISRLQTGFLLLSACMLTVYLFLDGFQLVAIPAAHIAAPRQ